MKRDISAKLFIKAKKAIPGGVNSPVRACRSVGMDPVFIQRAEGSKLFDADGNSFIDYIGSWGPMILGHRHPQVICAIEDVLSRGTSFGAPTDLEVELAEMVISAVPSVEMVRMVNSGTEATMSAVRLARGVTVLVLQHWAYRAAPVSLRRVCKTPSHCPTMIHNGCRRFFQKKAKPLPPSL